MTPEKKNNLHKISKKKETSDAEKKTLNKFQEEEKNKHIPKIPLPKPTNPQHEIKELKKWFTEEIKKRDKIIDKLKKENQLLFKNSIKQTEKLLNITDRHKPKTDNSKENN